MWICLLRVSNPTLEAANNNNNNSSIAYTPATAYRHFVIFIFIKASVALEFSWRGESVLRRRMGFPEHSSLVLLAPLFFSITLAFSPSFM